MKEQLENRLEAGRLLATKLSAYQHRDDVIILALPRGGVPVAYEVATALQAPLDVLIVRKLGIPQHEEFAMGAIARGGVRVLNQDVVKHYHISNATIAEIEAQERQELQRREHTYRGDRPWPALKGKQIILVDDGLATGATMRAAIEAIRKEDTAKIIMAIPVAPQQALHDFKQVVDEVVCLITPEPFYSVGQWYKSFNQTSDEDVLYLLKRSQEN